MTAIDAVKKTALVNAGGDLAVLGLPPTVGQWPIAVPGRERFWTIPLHSGAVATSGIAHRHWWQGNTLRHHLLDPGRWHEYQQQSRELSDARTRALRSGESAAEVAESLRRGEADGEAEGRREAEAEHRAIAGERHGPVLPDTEVAPGVFFSHGAVPPGPTAGSGTGAGEPGAGRGGVGPFVLIVCSTV